MQLEQEFITRSNDPEDLFASGMTHLKKHRSQKALEAFRKAMESRPDEPRFMSYFGLCLATAENRPEEAVPLCERAVIREFYRPELFFNLGRVYLLAGDAKKAYEIFTRGLALDMTNNDLRRELRRMGRRRRPIIPGLARSNGINRLLGKVLYRIRNR